MCIYIYNKKIKITKKNNKKNNKKERSQEKRSKKEIIEKNEYDVGDR